MKHTPGPWKYSVNVGPTKALIVEEDGTTIFELRLNVRDSRLEANARLIAAAPELLEACKKYLQMTPSYEYRGAREVLENAIATAEGRQ